MPDPYLIEFARLGAPDIGYISVAESQAQVPFAVQRVFWTYDTPETIVRGRHAHFGTEQVLIAVAGRIIVTVEQEQQSKPQAFRLESPHQGLYIPPRTWHTMHYSPGAVQLVLASQPYNEEDYIRDYERFRALVAGR